MYILELAGTEYYTILLFSQECRLQTKIYNVITGTLFLTSVSCAVSLFIFVHPSCVIAALCGSQSLLKCLGKPATGC